MIAAPAIARGLRTKRCHGPRRPAAGRGGEARLPTSSGRLATGRGAPRAGEHRRHVLVARADAATRNHGQPHW